MVLTPDGRPALVLSGWAASREYSTHTSTVLLLVSLGVSLVVVVVTTS